VGVRSAHNLDRPPGLRAAKDLPELASREFFPEFPAEAADEFQLDPAWRVLRCLDPGLPRPQRLELPGLAALRGARGSAIGLVPFADEPRRNMDAASVVALAGEIARRHPGDPIWILVDPGEAARIGAPLPPGVEFVSFATLEELIDRYARLKAWYGTDTGPYHLAVAMGIPTTTFFGPTQPLRNSFPAQPDLERVRLSVLGNEHCEQKQCAHPLCLHQAVANFAGAPCATRLQETPAGCPCGFIHPTRSRATHEDPHHQARQDRRSAARQADARAPAAERPECRDPFSRE